MNEVTSRPSRAPEAPQKKNASRQVTRAALRHASSQSTCCAQLVSRCSVKVDAASRAFYTASLTDEAAAVTGKRVAARSAITEWITVANKLVRWVLAGRVAGYGAVRFHYAAELALTIANDRPEANLTAKPDAEASTAPTPKREPAKVGALKRKVAQGLRNLGVEVSVGVRENASASRVSHSLEALAAAVLRAQSTIPAAVMADAGLTQTVIDALNTAAENAMSAHAVHVEARTTELSAARREDVLLGRLVREIRVLAASSRTTHRDDPEVPAVRSSLLASTKMAKKAAPARPVTPPADPPAPR